jgi:cytochrome P450
MTPKVVAEKKAFVRQLSTDLIEAFVDRGSCKFISEFADILPLTVFLDLVELPFDGRENLGTWVEKTTRDPDPAKKVEAMQNIATYLTPYIDVRRNNPGTDMLSAASNAEVNGCPIGDDAAIGATIHMMMAGLDTVSSMLGFVMTYLAQNPHHRQALVDDPALISRAVNEISRRFPTVTMVRQVRMDIDYLGVKMKQGDMVALPSASYNLDPAIYEDPLSLDWSRRVKQVLTFGNGVHRCPGASLGHAELVIVLEEWLKRIPDFSVMPNKKLPVCGGTVAKILELPLIWGT